MAVERHSGLEHEPDIHLSLALRASNLGIWEWDLATGEMRYSERARAICGFRPDEQLTIDRIRAVTHPDDLVWTAPKAQRALDPEVRDKSPFEYRIVRADNGEVRWVLAHGEAIFVEVGGVTKAVRYLGSLEDITDRKNAEEALKASERRLSLAIDAARMAVWEYDAATDSVAPSPELNRLFGLRADVQPTIAELRERYDEDERQKIREAGQAALAKGVPHFETEFQCTWPDGSRHWLLLRADIRFDEAGQLDKVIGVLVDIDERKRHEERTNLLLREVNHRVKNSLGVVQALATQTFKHDAPDALAVFRDRLSALAWPTTSCCGRTLNGFP